MFGGGHSGLLMPVKVSCNPADMTKCDETLMAVDYVNLPRVVEIAQRALPPPHLTLSHL